MLENTINAQGFFYTMLNKLSLCTDIARFDKHIRITLTSKTLRMP